MPLRITEDEGKESTPSSTLSVSSVVSESSPIAITHEESSDEIIPLRRSTRLKIQIPNILIIFIRLVSLLLFSSRSLPKEFKSQMMNEFKMSAMSLLQYFLGLQGIFISQRKYARYLLNKFGMLNCKPAVNEEQSTDAKRFKSLVGALCNNFHSYTMGQKRESCGTFLELWTLVFDTPKLIISYCADSDWAKSLEDRQCVSANVFNLDSGVVTWSIKKKATTSLSTSEVETLQQLVKPSD
uniref:Reverse transcriptase Ty1/copia-type domain-containing protein n=1 Tax=Solanum lycopersicum TaxID=4081 RepID=A0A3Q7H802_SOLLC